jgi:hypothetical protein
MAHLLQIQLGTTGADLIMWIIYIFAVVFTIWLAWTRGGQKVKDYLEEEKV